MRVALLTPGGVGDETSGMHIPVLRDFVERLSMLHDVFVYSLAPTTGKSPDGQCGNARIRFFPIHHRNGTAKKLWFLFNACRKDHRLHRFDLVHALWAIPCGATAVLLGKHLGIPAVVSFLGGETACLPQIRYGNMSRRATKRITLWVARNADAVVTLTHNQRNELDKFDLASQSPSVIPFGSDISLFTTTEKDIAIRPLRFLSVGNIHAVKDHPTLLRTFRAIAESVDARLRIIGEDQSGGALSELASQLGLRDKIEFLGHAPHRDLPQHYQWAHVFLHTSLHEAQGVVIAEAAASGVLVAGTQTGLLADLGDTRAVISAIADHQSLSQKILHTVADQSRYDTLRNAGRQWAESHDSSWTVREYLRLYDEVTPQTRR